MTVTFAAENTLGKLAKWLRILGFDTLYDSGAGGAAFFRSVPEGRVLLTRTVGVEKQLRSDRLLFIQSDDFRRQLGEVIRQLEIRPEDLRPFTRCIECNQIIESVEKPLIRHRVPDFVYESHEHFQQCPRCRKVFWSGSHTNRVLDCIRQLFDVPRPCSNQKVLPV
jgi:uncharacterized protein with PIN domain